MVEKANVVYESKIVKNNNGWGYNIYVKDKMIIEQNIIPSVAGVKGFATKEEAQKVANLALYKLNTLKQKFPSISLHELDSLQIKY